MWDFMVHWFSNQENVKMVISNLIFPIIIGVLAFIAANSVNAWRTRRRQSLLGSAVCASLIEELRHGIAIMETVQTSMNTQQQAMGILPRKSWSGMNTISDEILERLLCLTAGKNNRGFPIKEIRIHLKNYFDHMCPNFDNVTSAMGSGAQWQTQAQFYLVQGKYIEAAKGVLAMLEDAERFLENNAKAIMPK